MSKMRMRDRNSPRREQRQAEAKVRQEAANKRSVKEQVLRLDVAHLVAKKERFALDKCSVAAVALAEVQVPMIGVVQQRRAKRANGSK